MNDAPSVAPQPAPEIGQEVLPPLFPTQAPAWEHDQANAAPSHAVNESPVEYQQSPPHSDQVFAFSCPACSRTLSVAKEQVGEAIDCSWCGVAVVSPDPLRGEPAILFSELLERMGIAPLPISDPTPAIPAEEPVPQRQIAEFQLRPVAEETLDIPAMPDLMAWLAEDISEPKEINSHREPLWPFDDKAEKTSPAPSLERKMGHGY
jgi:hypothetical protein